MPGSDPAEEPASDIYKEKKGTAKSDSYQNSPTLDYQQVFFELLNDNFPGCH